ncbi:lactate dehydrogenase [Pseudomonas tohonis]|uniref:Lactate dehydrogenase n=1 Tax=Pseudomonas tohonis TaxID=2725477 RepID=A0A6J4E3P4_9PSED|nr:lactate dehydrogenase [Pseudomonas tohonis]
MNDLINLSLDQVHALALRAATVNGMGEDHARAIADTITRGQRDECHSHGLYRVLVCVHSLRSGKVDPQAQPRVSRLAPAIVRVDAQRGYSLLALQTGLPLLVEQARELGVAALVIRNCFHFSALWPEVEAIAAEGLVGLAMTPSHAWVAPEGGRQGVFGTNPLAFAWPREGREPFVFDFATSAIARGDIELHARQGKPIPLGWGLDAEGRPSTDARAVLEGAMQTFGGHKGSALAAMIELMAGALIGDLTSAESLAFDGGAGATPLRSMASCCWPSTRRAFSAASWRPAGSGPRRCSPPSPTRARGCRRSGVSPPASAANAKASGSAGRYWTTSSA